MSLSQKLKVKTSRALEKTGMFLADLGLGRIKLLSDIYYKIRANIAPDEKVWVSFEGFQILADPTDFVGNRLLRGRFHEEELKEVIEEEAQQGDRVVDIGAHIGSTALVFRNVVGEEGEVICFEPNPESFEILRSTVERNSFKNFKLFNQALGDSKGKIELEHNSKNTGESSIRSATKVDETFEVRLAEASDELEKLGEIDWLKIDVEGAEYDIISALAGDIQQFKGIFLEIHPDRLSDDEIEQIYEILSGNGTIQMFTGEVIGREHFIKHAKNHGDVLWKNNSR